MKVLFSDFLLIRRAPGWLRRPRWLAVAWPYAALAVGTALFAYGYFGGYEFQDDYHYARFAFLLSQGQWESHELFAHRWAVYVPTALLYRLFGVSDLTTALWPWLFAVGTLCLLCAYLRPRQSAAFALTWLVTY